MFAPLRHAAAAAVLRLGSGGAAQTSRLHDGSFLPLVAWNPPWLHRMISYSGLRQEDLLLPKVTIIGRPNVGKSALFNKLIRRKAALVYDTPDNHVTRDFKEGVGKLGDLRFRLVDTSGLEPDKPQKTIQGRAVEITARVLKSSHVTLLVVDAKSGLLASDEELAQWLRKTVHPDKVLVVANKAENQRAREGMSMTVHDCYRLGFGEPIAVSATTGEGMVDLYSALQPFVDEANRQQQEATQARRGKAAPDAEAGEAVAAAARRSSSRGAQSLAAEDLSEAEDEDGGEPGALAAAGAESSADPGNMEHWLSDAESDGEEDAEGDDEDEDEDEDDPEADAEGGSEQEEEEQIIRIAILGQPNVGKSTLLNSLLQEQRSLTGPEPGLTRDAVHASMTHGGMHLELVDTAGWVGITRTPGYDDVGGAVADMARRESARALAAAHVAVLVLDAERALRMQRVMTQRELSLASLALSEGRALVLAANKLDVLPAGPRALYLSTLRSTIEERFLEAGDVPVVGISALTSQGLDQLMQAMQQAFRTWNRRVSTGRLNRFIHKLRSESSGGGAATALQRVKYMTQVKARPPSFAAFLSGSAAVDDSFVRFLAGELRRALGFQGVPVRIWFRYKEARSAIQRAAHVSRGRPLAMRGAKTQERKLKLAPRRGPQQASFLTKAKGILQDLAAKGGAGAAPSRQAEAGKEKKSRKQGAGGGQVQAAAPSRRVGGVVGGAGAGAGVQSKEAKGSGSRSIKGAKGPMSRSEVAARLMVAHKPTAALFPQRASTRKKKAARASS